MTVPSEDAGTKAAPPAETRTVKAAFPPKESGPAIQARGNAAAGRPADNAAALRLGLVLQLARRARQADAAELPFVIANETRQLLPYRQAAFWTVEAGRPKLKALSGLAIPDHNAPYVLWINRFAKWRLAATAGEETPKGRGSVAAFSLAELAAAPGAPAWLAEWKEWLPEHGASAVLFGPGGWVCGVLCLFRETPFSAGETNLLSHLADAYGDILGGAMMRPRRRAGGLGLWRAVGVLLILAAAAAMFHPVPQTSLAPAEVAARSPAIVRAGVDGVVETFLVEPNQMVKAGDHLLRLEDTQLRTRLAVARKAEEMARVELRQLRQAALHDPRSKARIPLAEGRVDQLAAESEYVRTLLERVTAASPMDGVALVDNPDDWKGRPVNLGQKIMMVADPADVMLEIFLPASETMPLEPGDELLFFPNVAPASPVKARIVFVGYRAGDVPGLGLAFQSRAEFVDAAPPMLGLRGTARLTGRPLPLGLIILRRPIMAVRQWLGW